MWEGETVVRRCDSSQGGVKIVVWFQLMERYDARGEVVRRCGKVWEGMTVVTNCDSPQGGVKSKDRCVI